MIDFTYNPIIPADYKSKRERTSLRSLSLPGSPFLTEENGLSWKHPVVSVRRAFSGAWMVRDESFVAPDADRDPGGCAVLQAGEAVTDALRSGNHRRMRNKKPTDRGFLSPFRRFFHRMYHSRFQNCTY